jgi:Lipopolysaccharide export system permease LptF/LptG
MTREHPVRRVLARVCSTETMSRIVDPVLADVRFEDGRLTGGGLLALARALALHAITSIPRWFLATWSQDGGAIPRVAGIALAWALGATIPLIAPPFVSIVRHTHASPLALCVLLLPQALVLTLPTVLLIAIPLALRRILVGSRVIRRTIGLSVLVMGATFAVAGWAMPAANRSFRVLVAGSHELPRGPNDVSFGALRSAIADLRQTDGGASLARDLEYVYERRLALIAAAVPLGLAGLAISVTPLGRRRPLVTGVMVTGVYWMILAWSETSARAVLVRDWPIPLPIYAWLPNVLMMTVSVIRLSRRFPIPPTPPRASPAA